MTLPEPMLLYAQRFSPANPVIHVNTGLAQDVVLVVAEGRDYFMAGDADVVGGDLVALLELALNTNTNGVVFTVTLSDRNFVTITASAPSSILWSASGIDADLFGFAGDLGPGTSFVAPYQARGTWIPGTAARPVPFRTDSRREPVTVGALMETENGDSRGYEVGSDLGERKVTFHLIDRAKILAEYAPTDEPFGTLETAWTTALVRGRTVRIYDDRSVRSTSSYGRYRVRARRRPWTEMGVSALKRYELELVFREAA